MLLLYKRGSEFNLVGDNNGGDDVVVVIIIVITWKCHYYCPTNQLNRAWMSAMHPSTAASV